MSLYVFSSNLLIYGICLSYRLDTLRLNDMVYVYYNLRLWVKQIEKTPDVSAISLDEIDTTAAWRVETERPILESAPEWIEDDAAEPEPDTDAAVEGGEEEDWLDQPDFTFTDDAPFQEVGLETGIGPEAEPKPQPQRFVEGQGLGAVGGSSGSGPSASTSRAHQGASASTSGARMPPPPATGSSRGRRPPVRATQSRATSGRPPLPVSSRGRAIGRAVTLSRKRGRGSGNE